MKKILKEKKVKKSKDSIQRNIADLKLAEERFRLAAEVSTDFIYEWDIISDELEWYGDFESSLGYKHGEIPRTIKAWLRLIHPDDQKRLKGSVKLHRTSTKPIYEEYGVRRKDGSWAYWIDRGTPVLNIKRKPIKWIGGCKDITERRKSEEALKQSEIKYRTLVENASEIILVAQDGVIKFANKKLSEATNFKKEELIEKPFVNFIHPDDKELIADRHRRRLKGENIPVNYEFRIVDKSGNVKWMNIFAILSEWEGKPATFNFLTDVTERRLAESEIAEWKKRYDLIVASSGSIIYDYNVESGEIEWGGSVEQILGYHRKDAKWNVEDWEALIYPDDRDEVLRLLDMAKNTLLPYDAEYRYRKKDGEYLWVCDHGFFIPDEKGKPVRMLGMMQDITKRKNAEELWKQSKKKLEEWSEQLEEQVKSRTRELKDYHAQMVNQEKMALLGQVSTSLSHELRTPLTGIKNTVYLMNSMHLENADPKAHDYLSLINSEVDACTRVLNNMMDYVRPKMPVKKEVCLEGLIKNCLSAIAFPSGIKIKSDYNPDVPSLKVDPFQIQQVFENIIRNAVEAMGSGGEILITTRIDGDWALASFKDTGIGISDENQKRIFEPLFSSFPGGVGLGLTVCRQLVEVHGGAIEVISKMGEGSTFIVKLPLKAGN